MLASLFDSSVWVAATCHIFDVDGGEGGVGGGGEAWVEEERR